MAIIQVWSAPSCQSGAVCFGPLAPWVSATGTEATGTPEAFRVTVTREVADAASLAEGRCLRVLSQSRGEQWWFVSGVTDSDGDAGLVSVTAGPLRQLLTVRGLVRDGSAFAFAPGVQTVTQLLNSYVLTNLADDGLSWLSLGTIDFTDFVEIGALDRVTRAAVLDAIEGQTGQTARLRAVYTSGVLTGFAIDVVADIAAGTETVPLATGASLAQVQRTRDALRAATVAVPFTANGAPMDQTAWLVDSTSGTAPAWIVLRDPVTANPWPIQEDAQLVGAYLRQRDGTQSQITDSRASDSAVQIASVGSLVAGDEVTIVRDTSGRPVLELTSPSGVTGSRGRLVGTVSSRVTDGRRNLAPNGTLATFTGEALTGWSNANSNTHGKYARTEPTTWSATLNATLNGGQTYTSLAFTGGGPASVLLPRERILVGTIGGTAQYATVADGAPQVVGATGTITIDSFTAAISYGTTTPLLMVRDISGTTSGSRRRPSAFPLEAAGANVVALTGASGAQAWPPTTTERRLESPAVAVVYDPARPYLKMSAGLTVATASATTDTGSTRDLPAIMILDTTGPTIIATGKWATGVATNTTAHQTLDASVLLTAARTVRAAVLPGNLSVLGGYVRWVSLWIDTQGGTSMGPQRGSGSNLLWHRAQDVLSQYASGTRYTVRGLDLQRLLAETGALALGQSVRLRSDLLGVNTTVKIVKLDYDFTSTESLALELGAITPRLTGVTVSL